MFTRKTYRLRYSTTAPIILMKVKYKGIREARKGIHIRVQSVSGHIIRSISLPASGARGPVLHLERLVVAYTERVRHNFHPGP